MATSDADLKNRLSRLTFTRAIAAMIVVASHFGGDVYPLSIPAVASVFRHGSAAVGYFFFLSGVIMSVVYATDEPARFDKGAYWVARVARIYPVYAIGLIAAALISPPTALDALLNVGLIQAWSHDHALSMNAPGWSLSAEIFFYIAFPFFLPLLTRRKIRIAALLAVGLCICQETVIHTWRHFAMSGSPMPAVLHIAGPYFPPVNFPMFFAGAVMGAALKWGLIPTDKLAMVAKPMVAAVCLALWIHYRLPLFAVPFAWLVAALLYSPSKIVASLGGRWPKLLGESSYALYILHYPAYVWAVNTVFPQIGWSSNERFYAYLLVLWLLSLLVFSLIETPARKSIRAAFGRYRRSRLGPNAA